MRIRREEPRTFDDWDEVAAACVEAHELVAEGEPCPLCGSRRAAEWEPGANAVPAHRS